MFGGGRYDNLVGLFVKNAKISGVGYGMGDVTLENFLKTHNLVPDFSKTGNKVLVTRFADVPLEAYTALVDCMQAAGVCSSLYLGNKKFGKQIDYAAKSGYSHVVIMGGDELAAGMVKVKDLATREESVVAIDALADFFA